ncbi:MAG TPA: TrkA family potassium uptake protein [Flexilinea sp.]|jgi:trk system potassium uptake protein TrkA|nr:TrkA family potassium uptake protein [Flexilinea sp.]HOW07647.1 TrkA family potassium uptake protein [Flexilinea sp.]HPS48640.1 TrkA family potassium uptake protein [Flexilinea sp.]
MEKNNVIIIGCGRMGAGLALRISARGQDVTVIDSNPEAFWRLESPKYTGGKIVGIGFDRDVLIKAGIETAYGVVSCTSKDETNAVIGRMARLVFRVPVVIARLYDPLNVEIYNRLGIRAISTTTWGIDKALNLLSHNPLDTVMEFAHNDVSLIRVEANAMMEGHTVHDFFRVAQVQVVVIERGNSSFIPTFGTKLEAHDVLFVCVDRSQINAFKHSIGME